MAQRLDATGIAPLTPVRAALAVEALGEPRQQALQRSLQALLGQSLQGAVLARLTDGSALVKVAGNSVRMTLPPDFPVGSEVPLTLIEVDPRPTFQIGRGRDSASGANGSVTLTYAEAPPEAEQEAAEPGVARRQTQADSAPPAPRQPGADPAALARQSQAAPDSHAAPPKNAAEAATAAQAHGAGEAQPAVAPRPPSLAAIQLSKAPLTPSNQLPGFDPSAPPPALSSAARAISTVLTQAESRPGAPLSIIGTAPLAQSPDAHPAALARSLHDAVGASGLFYESHVAEWAEGKRPLQELMREPQMAHASHATQAAQDGRAAPVGTDLAAAQFINLQLHTHEQARVLWQGEVWPGQQMEWEINKDAPQDGRDGRGADDQAQTWRSGVRFHFPLLGSVSASVVMVGDQVHIQIRTGSEESAAALRLGAGALEQSMDAAGSPLSSLTIGRQDGAGNGH